MDFYLILKTLHIVGVVMFLGNIIVTGWWKYMADRTRDAAIIAFAQRQVTLTDWVFTAGGVLLVLATGLANALSLGWPTERGGSWLSYGMMLFALSGVIWLAVLVPLQIKLGRMATAFAASGRIPDQYWRLERWWLAVGLLDTILPMAVIPIMVFK